MELNSVVLAGYEVMHIRIRKQNKVSLDVLSDNLLLLQHSMDQPGRDFAQNFVLEIPLVFFLSQFSLQNIKYSRWLGLHLDPVLSIIIPQ